MNRGGSGHWSGHRLRDAGGRQARLWAQCLELAEEQERLHEAAPLVAAVDEVLATRPRRD